MSAILNVYSSSKKQKFDDCIQLITYIDELPITKIESKTVFKDMQ